MRGRAGIALALAAALALLAAAPSPARAAFGFRPGAEGFAVEAIAEGGAPATEAGSHPYELRARLAFNRAGESFTEGDLRDLKIEEPAGLIENPGALPKCPLAAFNTPRSSPFEASASGESCPQASQIGIATIQSSHGGGSVRSFGVFNLEPAPGAPAQFGLVPYGVPIVFNTQIRPGAAGEYALTLEAHNFPEAFDLYGMEMTIWGVPWGVSHNSQRGNCLNEREPSFGWGKCSVGPPVADPPEAYLTLPASCEAPLAFSATADSWQGEGARASSQGPEPLKNCDSLGFDPRPVGQLVNPRAASPSGYEFDLTNNNEALLLPGFRVPSQVRDALVSLPEGVTINPSVGAGLGVCTPAGYAAETASSPPGAGCPNDSKIGDFTVQTPLYSETLHGAIFLATPFQNPFGSLIAVYLVAKAPQRDVLVKVAGKLVPDPSSGQLTATFQDLPQLPYTNLAIHFREGQRAPLVTPSLCGAYLTQSDLTPWLGALGEARRSTASHVEAGPGGGPCPTGAAPPFAPGARGGTLNSNAGSYSPFYLHLTRQDTEAEITSYSATLPPGLLGKIAGIPYCPEAAIEAAKRRSGIEEAERPSCPAASEIGHTTAGYGVGSALTYAPGRLYLAGPYHGSGFSVVAIDSALVGPFDLGVVVVRSAIKLNPFGAQVSIDSRSSDPIPHIIDGIPIHLRDIRVYISRPGLTINPTSCEPLTLASTLTGSSAPFADPFAQSATARVRFQASNCSALGFSPRLSFKLRGGATRGSYPALHATVEAHPGEANIAAATVTLPPALFLAQNRIRTICTRTQLAADNCPPGAVYGQAEVSTPLLSEPMRGPVYLVSSSHVLPDLLVALRGQGLTVYLEGRIDSAHSGIRASFEGIPDAPFSEFRLTMFGGRRGVLVDSSNLCAGAQAATARFVGQNNRVERQRPRLAVAGCHKHRRHRRHG